MVLLAGLALVRLVTTQGVWNGFEALVADYHAIFSGGSKAAPEALTCGVRPAAGGAASRSARTAPL
jgi:hypothetical protein